MRYRLAVLLLGPALLSSAVHAAEAPKDPEEVVVTATRTPRPEESVPAAVVVISRQALENTPALTSDEVLRGVPSAATFRRSSSLSADPSSQGLNLRGIGPSGVSRALVLVDGLPANDPFGGWVYWRALPTLGLARIEVVPGGGSALWGNAALGGVVHFVTRPIEEASVEALASGGTQGTAELAARVAHRWGRLGASLEIDGLRTDGAPVVAPDQRGAIDGNAPSAHASAHARAEFQAAPGLLLTARASAFTEDQNGGTQFTTASVRTGDLGFGARLASSRGLFEASLSGGFQSFAQQRARIGNERATETLAASQDVPSSHQALQLTWTSAPDAFGSHALLAGLDLRRIVGISHETIFPAQLTPSSVVGRDAGGEQQLAGIFVQDSVRLSNAVELFGAVRLDGWRNVAGERSIERKSGERTQVAFDDRASGQIDPKLGVLVRPAAWLTVSGSAYRAFRAPTLNELYRPFQVGTVLTAANENLQAESLLGAETTVEARTPFRLRPRLTAFWSQLDDPVTNVTLDAPRPDGATRMRQNLGQARAHGLEADVRWRPALYLTLQAAYTWTRATVASAPGAEQLVGKQLPQAPAHRASVQLAFERPEWITAALQLRCVGEQFEDDRNTLPLAPVCLVDLFAARRLVGRLDLFLAGENLLDTQYVVGRAGVDTIGLPRQLRLGLRLRAEE